MSANNSTMHSEIPNCWASAPFPVAIPSSAYRFPVAVDCATPSETAGLRSAVALRQSTFRCLWTISRRTVADPVFAVASTPIAISYATVPVRFVGHLVRREFRGPACRWARWCFVCPVTVAVASLSGMHRCRQRPEYSREWTAVDCNRFRFLAENIWNVWLCKYYVWHPVRGYMWSNLRMYWKISLISADTFRFAHSLWSVTNALFSWWSDSLLSESDPPMLSGFNGGRLRAIELEGRWADDRFFYVYTQEFSEFRMMMWYWFDAVQRDIPQMVVSLTMIPIFHHHLVFLICQRRCSFR